MSRRTTSLIHVGGLLLFLVGLPIALGYVCALLFSLTSRDSNSAIAPTVALTFTLLTLGAGTIVFRHSARALNNQPSAVMTLPPIITLIGAFALLLIGGAIITTARFVPAFFLPPIIVSAAALPPLIAVAWFAAHHLDGVTWRRGIVAFFGGATMSVALAIILELALPIFVLALVSAAFNAVSRYLQSFLDALAGANIANALTSPGFILLFVQLAIIAPVVEEFVKPLLTLPLLRQLARRDAFLLGALAGAGFAAVENIVYTNFGFALWSGVLLLRAIGCAIHPFGAGMVAVGWRAVLLREPQARKKWLMRFGAACGMHALWNGGSLLILTLAGAQFFGRAQPTFDLLGLSITGILLAFLIVLGLTTLWLGRAVANERSLLTLSTREVGEFDLSDRAIAVWAVACLVVIVPLGVTALQLVLK